MFKLTLYGYKKKKEKQVYVKGFLRREYSIGTKMSGEFTWLELNIHGGKSWIYD